MGTFFTQEDTPELYDDKEPAPGVVTPAGLTNSNLPRALDFNRLKAALFDAREADRRTVKSWNEGIRFDNSTDDTAAWNALLSDFGSRSGTIIVPDNATSRVTGLTYVGSPSYGLVLRGESGAAHTGARILYTGAAGGTLFRTRGMCRSSFWGVDFDANNLAKYAFLMEYNSDNNGGAFYNSFFGCKFANANGVGSAAFGIGTLLVDTFQASDTKFFACEFDGTAANSAAGVKTLVGGNVKNFWFFGCRNNGSQIPYDFTQASGTYNVTGGFCGNFTNTAFKVGPTGHLSASGIQVETSGSDQARFLDGSASANDSSASLINCEVNVKAPDDDMVVRWYGALTIMGGRFHNSRQGAQTNIPKIAIAAQDDIGVTGPGSVTSLGAYYANVSADGYAPFYDDGGNALLGTDNARLNRRQVFSRGDYGGLFGSGTLGRLRNVDGDYHSVNVLETRNGGKAPTYSGRTTDSKASWTFSYTDFQVAATEKEIDLFEPTRLEHLRGFSVEVTQAFGGTAGTITLQIGDTIGGAEVMTAQNVKLVAVFDGASFMGVEYAAAMDAQGYYVQLAGVARIKLRMISGSGNLSGLNAGSVTIKWERDPMP
jgi:hypothetical protein